MRQDGAVPKRTQTFEQQCILSELAARIRAVRAHYDVTQQDFASKLGVSRSHLSEVERHKAKPSIEMAVGIARAYPGVRTEWLLLGEKPMFEEAEEKAQRVSEISKGSGQIVIEIIEDLHLWHLNNRGKGLSAELWASLVHVLPGIFTTTYSLAEHQPGGHPPGALEEAVKLTRRAAEAIVSAAEPS